MEVRLTKEQEEWLDAKVASGAFATRDEVISRLIAGFMAFEEVAGNDMMWAKNIVDLALAKKGYDLFMPIEEYKRHVADYMCDFKEKSPV